MKKNILSICLVFVSTSAYALPECPDSVKPIEFGEDGRFSITNTPKHTDWVKMRGIVNKKGRIGDIKPIEHSSDLYTNQAHKRARKIIFNVPTETCFKDILLYQVLEK